MTEDYATCVRGCTRRCTADQCLTTGEHDHEPLRRRATVGLLCKRCDEQLTEAVHDIPDLWAQMPGLYDTGHAEGEKVSHGKVTGSPSLIRLDVMVLNGSSVGGQYEGDGVMPVWPTIGGWIQILAEELGTVAKSDTIAQWCDLLRRMHPTICRQPWVDEYWADMVAIRQALRRTTGAPPPVGRCFGHLANRPCGRLLYPPAPGETEIVCPDEKCGRRYSGAELLKLQIQGEREGVA